MTTKIKTKPTTMHDKLDKIIDKLDNLSSDVIDGTITANSIFDRIEKIRADVEKIQESL